MAPEGDLFQHGELCLEGKPSAALRYSYIPGNTVDAALVLFVNGLVLPQTGWRQTMQDVVRFSDDAGQHHPALLSYDRFGQGVSDPDPADDGKVDGHTHDLNDVVRDLYDFLSQFSETRPASERSSKAHRQLILVCNSIGCPIARLFAQAHPGTVSGFIFLDSMVANVELFSVFPDPDSELFDGEHLPAGVTAEDVRHARQTYRRNFHSTLPNKERLNRANLARLLPNSDAPKLTTPGIEGPLLTVVGHDWNVFAAENKKSFEIPEAVCNEFINPWWHGYNQGLVTLTESQWSRGPIIAEGCSHFVQRDDPEFVAREILDMLQRIININKRSDDRVA